MAASLAQDSDSDFGYDFSAEEEELLIQLASNPRAAPVSGTAVIDTVPGKTDVISGEHAAILQSSSVALELQLQNDPTSRAIPPEVESRDLGSLAALDADVSYPDCRSTLLWRKAPSD